MTPLKDVFMLDASEYFDAETVSRVWQSGRSRIPVCDGERTNVIGMLFAKDLLVVRTEDHLSVKTILTFYGQPEVRVWSDQRLDAIFTGTYFLFHLMLSSVLYSICGTDIVADLFFLYF